MGTKFNLLIVVLLLFAAVTPLSSQNAPAQTSDADNAKHYVAISLLRNINTIEVTYKFKHGGSYATWDALLASDEFPASKVIALLAKIDPQLANARFSNGPEILPGWSLRLNLTADGHAYDLLLEDLTDKTCGYAAITDERGVIRQSKAIDCKI
jgi:hypothetical protein